LPLALNCVSPLITLGGIYWAPESPRYLAWVDRKDEAWEVIRRLHSDASDPNETAAQAEFQQIVLQVEHDKQQAVTYWKMFQKPSWRRRSLVAIFLLYATQCTGILGIGNFQILLYNRLGLTGWIPLLFFAMYTMIGTVPNFICAWCMDRVGRRRLLLLGYPILTAALIIEMVLQKYYTFSADDNSRSGMIATV
jgi:hypothetical protein